MVKASRRSTPPQLRDAARHIVYPDGIVATSWPDAVAACDDMGIFFDPWQDDLGRLILARRDDGTYAASVGGVVMSIPRQVGKTFLIGSIIFALCRLFPGMLAVWTSHHLAVNNMTFRAMQAMAAKPKVAAHIKQVRTGKGDESIEFENESRILFGARSRGFGLGFSGVSILVLDEGQRLGASALDDMIPTMNTAPDPLYFIIGTPPRPDDDGEAFTRARDEALKGTQPDGLFIEFSADEDARNDDPVQWMIANPSYPFRTPETAMRRMLGILSPDSFQREALGIWSSTRGELSMFDLDDWAGLVVDEAPNGVTTYGVKFSPDGLQVALSVAVRAIDGTIHVEGVEHRDMIDGAAWLVDWLASRWRTCGAILLDGKSGAGALEQALLAARVPARRVSCISTSDAITANAAFREAIVDGRVSHNGDVALTESLRCSGRRKIGTSGGWGLMSINGGDCTLADSAVLAHFAAQSAKATSGRIIRVR